MEVGIVREEMYLSPGLEYSSPIWTDKQSENITFPYTTHAGDNEETLVQNDSLLPIIWN